MKKCLVFAAVVAVVAGVVMCSPVRADEPSKHPKVKIVDKPVAGTIRVESYVQNGETNARKITIRWTKYVNAAVQQTGTDRYEVLAGGERCLGDPRPAVNVSYLFEITAVE
jgi:hypothetical protein